MAFNKQMSVNHVYVHIVDANNNDLQWKAHRNTFQINTSDSFDDLRKNLIKKLPKEHEHISDCLKVKHKLNLLIDERTKFEDKHALNAMIQKYKNVKTEHIYLHHNILSTIQFQRSKVDIKNICIYFIGCDKNSLKMYPTPTRQFNNGIILNNENCNHNEAELSHLADVTSNTKHIKNKVNKQKKKRKRVENVKISNHKKRKPNPSIAAPECIWMFIDMAPTMNTAIFEDMTKAQCVERLVQEMVHNVWSLPECTKNHMRLLTFSNEIKDLTESPFKRYTKTKANILMTKLKQQAINTLYEECMSWKNALQCLIDTIIEQKNDKENIQFSAERNRIILLTDAERGRSDIKISEITHRLRDNIVLDVIHVTQTKRCNAALQELCGHDNVGKYWNPPLKTLGGYLAVMQSDIMKNTMLRDFSAHIIELE